MKKLLFYILTFLPFFAISQTSNGTEEVFNYGIKNNAAQTVTNPVNIVTQGADGTYGKILTENLPIPPKVQDSLDAQNLENVLKKGNSATTPFGYIELLEGSSNTISASDGSNYSNTLNVDSGGVNFNATDFLGGTSSSLSVNADGRVEIATDVNKIASYNGIELETVNINSSGAIQGFSITNNGNGTVNITSGTAYLKAINDPYANLAKYTIPAVTNLSFTDNTNNYVLVDYSGGTPAISVTTDPTTINTTTNSILAIVSRHGVNLDYISLVGANVDANGKLRRRFLNSEGIKRLNGMALGFSNRNLTVTAGSTASGLIPLNSPAFNTSVSDTFTLAYNNGSTWTRTTGQTQVNNTQYNVSGTLTAMGNNDYRTDYVYVLQNNPSKLYTIMGTSSYTTLSAARLAAIPSVLPVELQNLGILVGRLIIQKNASVITEVASSFDVQFSGSSVQNHNDLAGLQGGTAGEYNHLTNAELATVASTQTQLDNTNKQIGVLTTNNFVNNTEVSSDFAITGSFTHNAANGLTISGGTSDYTKYLRNNFKTLLLKYSYSIDFTVSANGSGIAIGFANQYARIDNNTSGNRGKIYIENNSGTIVTSATALSYVNTDVVRLIMSRDGNVITVTAKNITNTSIVPVTISYTQILTPGNPTFQNFTSPTIFAYGGTQIISNATYSSAVKRNSDILIISDSNGEGWYQGSLNSTWVRYFMTRTKGSIEQQCRQGIAVSDATFAAIETGKINPKYAIVGLGTNNAAAGQLLASFQTDYNVLINSLVSQNIIPILLTIPPSTNSTYNTAINGYNAWIISNYTGLYQVIDVNSAISTATDLADSVHLNSVGAVKFAEKIIAELRTIGLINTFNPLAKIGDDFSGTGGSGYLGIRAQSSDPAALGVTGTRLFSDANGDFSFRKTNGSDVFSRRFIGTITANRSYTLDDRTGRFVTSELTSGYGYLFQKPTVPSGATLIGSSWGQSLTGTGSEAAVAFEIAPTFTSVAANPITFKIRNGRVDLLTTTNQISTYLLNVTNGTNNKVANFQSSVSAGSTAVDLINSAAANVANRSEIGMYVVNSGGSAKGITFKSGLSTTTAGSEISALEIWGNQASTTQAKYFQFVGDKFQIINSPTTSAGTYDFLVRNTSSGEVEKIASTTMPFKGTYSTTGTATTTFTVTIGRTMANTNYVATPVPTNMLSAVLFYVTNKTTTTFDIVVVGAGLTGTVAYDFTVTP